MTPSVRNVTNACGRVKNAIFGATHSWPTANCKITLVTVYNRMRHGRILASGVIYVERRSYMRRVRECWKNKCQSRLTGWEKRLTARQFGCLRLCRHAGLCGDAG